MPSSKNSHLPVLETERLLLRPLTEEDEGALFLLRSNEEVNRYINRPPCTTPEQAKQFIQFINEGIVSKGWLYWAICNKETGQLMGTLSIWNMTPQKNRAETGYELQPLYQGKGYMREALSNVIDWAFVHFPLEALDAFTHPRNKASKKLLLKLGFIADAERNNKEEGLLAYVLMRPGTRKT